MNFALAHVLGATIQTALFNSSLVVIVGWGLGKAMVSTPRSTILEALLIVTELGFRNIQRGSSHLGYYCRRELSARREVELP